MVIIGSPGKGPAFFRKQIQNIIFGREWNGLQKGIGVFPGERHFFVAKHNIIRNLALGGREPGMIQQPGSYLVSSQNMLIETDIANQG